MKKAIISYLFVLCAGVAQATVEGLKYPYSLPKLDYSYRALSPSIDARTMKIHLTKHHQGYVNNLNKALESHPELHGLSLEELLRTVNRHPKPLRNALKNNGGGHYNHTLFWNMMSPHQTAPSGNLLAALEATFGSLDAFKKQFNQAAVSVFGSGWAWLCIDDKGTLVILPTNNQDSPITEGLIPLLGLDVWEHAYYLKYQNKRPEYIDAWWKVVNWPYVQKRFERFSTPQSRLSE